MKKILFAAFAASLVAAGCQKTEVYQPANSGEKMTFSTEMKKITKAEGDGTTTSKNEGTQSLEKQGFNLWAYAAYSTENITNVADNRIYDGMEAMALSYSSAGSWGPVGDKAYYWPGQGKDLRFFAVSSNNIIMKGEDKQVEITPGIAEDKTSSPHIITLSVPTMSIKDYTVASTGDKIAEDDLMVADFLDQNQSENERTVALNFHHALSKVEFLFKATIPTGSPDNLKVYVQKLSVLDLCDKGTLSVTTTGFPTENKTYQAPVTLSWGSTQTGKASFTKKSGDEFTGSVELIKEGETQIFAENLATEIDPTTTAAKPLTFAKWLMLPQSITGKLVEIIYIIGDRQFKAVFPLDKSTSGEASLSEWETNKYIKYTVNLSPNMISFDAKVEEDWQPEGGNNIDHIN